jgi:hypothetical protein
VIAANVAPRTASAYYNDRNAFKNEKKMKSRGNITRTVKGLQRLKDRKCGAGPYRGGSFRCSDSKPIFM